MGKDGINTSSWEAESKIPAHLIVEYENNSHPNTCLQSINAYGHVYTTVSVSDNADSTSKKIRCEDTIETSTSGYVCIFGCTI